MQVGGCIAVNGRFLSRSLTGVERYACEITHALSNLLSAENHTAIAPTIKIITPGPATCHFGKISTVPGIGARLPGHAWEQFVLPFYLRHAPLLSLANSSPLLRRRQLIVVHDAAIYDLPQAFTREYRAWYKFFYSVIRRSSSRIVTVSQFSRERLAYHWGVDETQIGLVPNGCDHIYRIHPDVGILHRLGLEPRKYVLTLGNQAPQKNIASMLSMVPALAERGLKLVLAGGSNSRVFGDATIGDASGDVILTGRITDGEVRGLMENALAFAFPSLYEGFGIPPLEAMALGVPTAVANRRPFTDLFGSAAWLLDIGDEAASMVRYIDRLEQEPGYREQQSAASRLCAAGFTWRASAELLVKELAALTGSRRPGGAMPLVVSDLHGSPDGPPRSTLVTQSPSTIA